MIKRITTYISLFFLGLLSACNAGSGSMDGGVEVSISATDTPLTIREDSQLIGGPLAIGAKGDILLSNDKIRVIIQQPSKWAQVCPFGGVIVDADLVRPDGEEGQDNFGKMCPLVNIEWTINYHSFQVISEGGSDRAQILKAFGTIDVLDYLDLDFVAPVTKALTGQSMYFSQRFDDANDPFRIYEYLKVVNPEVVTTYTLDPGANYVKIETAYENIGDVEAKLPVGQFVNGSGELHTLIPGLGFTPPPTAQITSDISSLIYVPFEDVDVSYGYFYDVRQFYGEVTEAVDAQKLLAGASSAESSTKKRLISTSLSYSGVTGLLLGDEFLKVLPLGGPAEVKVNFTIQPHTTRTVTEYFMVGGGNAGSVFDSGMKALKIPTGRIAGTVVDAGGNPVKGVTVVVQNESETTIITYRTGIDGKFSGDLSRGGDSFAEAFGKGKYKIFVEKEGYHKEGTGVAGTCSPDSVDIRIVDELKIECILGATGTVQINGGVTDTENGKSIPARMTIVGFDPSPDSHAGAALATTHGAGKFEDTWLFERPWGIVDVKYVNARGGIGLSTSNSFNLEPGRYVLAFSRGIEYGMETREITVTSGGVVSVDKIKLKKVIKTPGWISGDFHLHSINSPDSAIPLEKRVLAASGEGMDTLTSTDHDWVTDYSPVVEKLVSAGLIPAGSLTTMMGDEISPNHYGHINAFPLKCESTRADCGAYDWSGSDFETIGTGPDFNRSPKETLEYYRSGGGGPQEKVLMVNHIADQPTSLLIVSSWVTTPAYKDLAPLSSYVDPSSQRIKSASPVIDIPTPFGTNDLVITDFTAVELTMSGELYNNKLRETGLPQWFNLLNLGILATAMSDSDSHRETVDQMGTPRNYIAYDIDPNDGIGGFENFNEETFARAINSHKVIGSTGPFIKVVATGDDGKTVGIGDVVSGPSVKFSVEVVSPSWAWFDTIEIYANTIPLPADDDGVSVFKGVASDPKSFFAPYHVPMFYYEPYDIFTTQDGSLKNFKEENGVITASAEFEMNVDKDTWVVVFVSGTPGAEGFRSLFPYVTKSIADPTKMKKPDDNWTIGSLVKDLNMATSAWAFANPVYIDVDGDADNDGRLFEGIYSNYLKNDI